jgi:uncharacterized protein
VPIVTVVHRPDLGRYEILCDDEVAGFTAYEMQGPHMAFMHTQVDPGFAGRGLGRRLVGGALADVATHYGTLLPYCSFVRSFIAREQRYLHLVPEEWRGAFGLLGQDDGRSDS